MGEGAKIGDNHKKNDKKAREGRGDSSRAWRALHQIAMADIHSSDKGIYRVFFICSRFVFLYGVVQYVASNQLNTIM